MSTRGIVGFRLNKKDYLTFNHWDSYPSALGEDVVNFVNGNLSTMEELRSRVAKIVLVEDGVENRYSRDDHDLTSILNRGVMVDDRDFANDSLFCEYGYVVNLDSGKLEVYEGFQTKKGKGRFASRAKKPKSWTPKYKGEKYYYPIGLVAEFAFDDLPPEGSLEYVLKVMTGREV